MRACWFNENGICTVVLVECSVYGPQCAYVYFVDVYGMYTLMWACAHFLFVFNFRAVFSFRSFSLLKMTKTDAGDFNMHFLFLC